MTRRVPWSDDKNKRFAKAWADGVDVHVMQSRFGFSNIKGVYDRRTRMGLPARVVAVKGEK